MVVNVAAIDRRATQFTLDGRMDVFHVRLKVQTRYRLVTLVAQNDVTSTVHLVDDIVDFGNVSLAALQISQLINQSTTILSCVQKLTRAGQLSLPHTEQKEMELKHKNQWAINPVNGLEPRNQTAASALF